MDSSASSLGSDVALAEEDIKQIDNILLSGSHFDVLEFEINEEYFGHRFVNLENFSSFLDTLNLLLTCSALNRKRDILLRDKIFKQVAKAIGEVRPSWQPEIDQRLEKFYQAEEQLLNNGQQ